MVYRRTSTKNNLQTIDISKFTTLDIFTRRVSEVISKVKSSRRVPGVQEILIPGEPEFLSEEKKLVNGIFIEDSTISKISEITSKFNIEMPEPMHTK